MPVDPIALTADLVRCNSVTPAEGGALVLLERLLTAHDFECTRVDRGGIANIFARWGRKGANRSFGFNGHTDVVPVGDAAAALSAAASGQLSAMAATAAPSESSGVSSSTALSRVTVLCALTG